MIEPPPCVPHVPRGVSRAGHHGPQVDRHDLVEVREVVVEQTAVHRARHPGVVDHDVQAAEPLDRRRHQAADLVEFGHVGLDESARRRRCPSASAAPASRSTSAISTLAPSAAKRRDRPSPRPDAPPVTIATLPSSSLLTWTTSAGPFVSSHDSLEKIQQQLVDGVGLFDLRAVAGPLDDGRSAVRDLLRRSRPPSHRAAVCRTAPSTTSVGTAMRS